MFLIKSSGTYLRKMSTSESQGDQGKVVETVQKEHITNGSIKIDVSKKNTKVIGSGPPLSGQSSAINEFPREEIAKYDCFDRLVMVLAVFNALHGLSYIAYLVYDEVSVIISVAGPKEPGWEIKAVKDGSHDKWTMGLLVSIALCSPIYLIYGLRFIIRLIRSKDWIDPLPFKIFSGFAMVFIFLLFQLLIYQMILDPLKRILRSDDGSEPENSTTFSNSSNYMYPKNTSVSEHSVLQGMV